MTAQFRAAILAVIALAGISQFGRTTDDKKEPKGQVVKEILEVKVAIQESFPPTLVITAVGEVPTGGWTKAKLTRREAKTPPKDGIYEYDLTAVPPDGIATQVISKVTATDRWKDPPKDLKAIKVYGVGDGIKTIKVEVK